MSEIQPGDSFDKSVGSGKGVIEDKGTCSHSEGDGDEEQRGDGGDTSENDSDDGDGSSSDSDSDTDEEGNNGLSEYERLRLERIARNNARLAELFPEDPNKTKKKGKKTPAKPRQSLPEGPRRQLPEREKRAVFNDATLTTGKKEQRDEEERNLDACYECQKEDGELVSCDFCRKHFHANCHTPPVSPDDDDFKCSYCEASGKYRRLTCGQCSGCQREMDCMTCVYCVNKYYRGIGKKKKCLFRRCQSWGKSKTENDSNNADHGEVEEDHHDVECFICKNGGDMICCDGCTKVYHSSCHKPKIYDLPEGDWYCMECNQSRKAYKRKYTGSLIADVGHRELKCTVRFPKITCITCDEVEATCAFKTPDWVTCRACDESYHLKCLDPPLLYKPNSWRCGFCKVNNIKGVGEKEERDQKKEPKPLFEGEHDDDCYMCFNGGDLLCCDYCSKAYHLECHLPPLVKIPTGLWKCQECAAVEYIRKMKCGECKACRADDCGKCEFCLDKPKFGGTNRLKQVCVKRKCPYMRFAPPAKVTPKELSKEEYRELKLQFAKGPPRPSKKRAREDTSGKDSREADYTPLQDDVSNKERGRPEKRQKTAIFSDTIEEPTDEASAKQQDPDEASAKQQDPKSDEKPVDEVSPTTVVQPHNIPVERKLEPDDNMLALISFIKSIPLNDDHIGKKIRQIIVNALQNPDNAKTQDLACEALRNLANDPDDVSKIIRLGGLKMVAKAMKDHPDKTIVQAEASALLSQLAWVDPACSAAIITEGLHHLVLSSMRRHVNHLKVQQMGCGFFRSLSYDFANHECIENVNGVVEIIDAMKRNAKKKLVMIEGCYFLQNILCNPDILPETIRSVVSSNISSTIIDGLSENIDDADYVDAACGVISNLAINEDARSNIGRYTPSIRSLLTILGPDTSEDAWKSSMNALKLLATGNVDTKTQIVCHGGIKKVIDILQTCQDADISHLGLQLLAELCRDDEDIANRLAESGCLNLVTNQMRKQPDLPFVQATCCGILRYIPIGNSDQAKCTTELILAAMEKHGEDKLVQFEGCHVLLRHCCRFASISEYLQSKVLCKAKANARPMRRQVRKQTCSKQPTGNSEPSYATTMTKQHHENEQESKYDDLDIDFIQSIKPLKDDHVGKKIRQIIVKALKNPDNSKTQDLACEALRKSTNVPDDVSKIIHHGGLKMVAKAMKDHPDKTIVQAEASALLAQLAWVDPVCVAAIIAEGLHHLVLSSMRRHVNHLKVQQMGCGFFRSLSYDFANHECIENVNGVVEIIDAMKRNAKKEMIMKQGCYFLQNILCNPDILPETIRLVVSSEVAFTVVDGLSENIDDADYVDAACGVISNLAINEDARSHVGDYQKSVPLLLTILGPDTSEDAWKSSMNALKLLATGNVDTKAKIVDHGGIKKVIDYMKQQNNDVVVVDTGLGLLSELASDNRKISRLLFNSGCFDLIKEATAKHSESPHIQARACELLSNLPIDANDVKGAIGFTLTAMTNHKLSFVQYAGCHALLQFCCRFPESAQLLQSKRASPILRQSQYTPWNDMINLNEFHE